MGNLDFFKYFRFFKVYRVNEWFHYLGFIILGLAFVNSLNFHNILILGLLGSLMLGFAYSFNEFYDRNLKKKLFLLPFFLSIFLFPSLNFNQLLICLSFLFISFLYSYPKFRWKSKPIVSTLSNSVGFLLLFLLGIFSKPMLQYSVVLILLVFFCLNTVAQLIHEIVHYKVDKKNNIFTSAVIYGIEKIKRSIAMILTLTIIDSFLLFLLFGFLLFFLSTALFSSYFLLKIKKMKINESFRKEFRLAGILTGMVYLFSLFFKV